MSQSRRSLEELEQRNDFIRRHVGPGEADQASMLALLGIPDLETLADRVIPESIRERGPLELDPGCSEHQALAELREIAGRNRVFRSFIGQGYYDCHTPPVILRNVLENPAWYTSYTPYQPEISQGRLEAMLNFQTMVSDLTGMDIANASLLDEATAAAEAMALSHRMSRSKSDTYLVSEGCHPQTIEVIRTRARPLGIQVAVCPLVEPSEVVDCFGILLQYPDTRGEVRDYRSVIEAAHERRALATVAADLLALTLLTPPGEMGADVAVGSAQRFGVPLGFGGPHAAYMATREALKRGIPGRLVGVSVDSQGNPAYRLALQTREQHIRREKATSNICTAQALLAVMAGLYAVYHGPEGLRTIAERVHRLTAILAAGLDAAGLPVANASYFDTLTVSTGERTAAVHEAARSAGVNLCPVDDAHVGVSLDETTTAGEVASLMGIITGRAEGLPSVDALDDSVGSGLPEALRRSSGYLDHAVFHAHRSETGMLRYVRMLSDRDLALDRAMIPLGSCTMKLNATAEMLPVTWSEFAGLHPFAPAEQTQGYAQLIADVERMLVACTGYDAVSLQPNAGSQGEFAGLLAIRAWHESRGEGHRNVCLIPGSAHGTNPASAHMAGMRVVVVKCDASGNVDLDDLRAQAGKHAEDLAALMVTYPSTHGVFEEAIREICEIVHTHGGQVFMDGANLNAMVGLCAPGRFGSDVSHLNLHKTFCIPHGGGGPGVGPVAVGRHLAPFLPGHPVLQAGEQSAVGPVAAAPWGSAGILPITWVYVRMMGREGLRHATLAAILNANYVARRLAGHYEVLYTGPNGMVAHECIIDLRPLKESSGVTVDDVAKRLIDYGFHAPTMSFPVAGTLMIEPTESESKEELDRFCDAMIRIRDEIRAIEDGVMDARDNPLKNAPHTAESVTADAWEHPYPREQAAYPVPGLRQVKYWSPAGRIDNVYGDRNLVCACPPLEAYEESA